MNNEIAVQHTQSETEIIEQVVVNGNLASLNPAQRVAYYRQVCSSLGLNPFTRPFDYITLNGKLTLYAKKDAADQLRKINSVSIDDVDIRETDTQFIVKVKGHDKTGRADVEVGVVNKKDMQGDTANAQMKAVTKAKRRLTLSLCGLGLLDETEVETIPNARPVTVLETGEIVDAGNGHAPAMVEAAQAMGATVTTTQPDNGQPSVLYAAPTVKIGKHQYPQAWGKMLAQYKRANQFEVDGILQKLALKQETPAENVIAEIDMYLDKKSELIS